MAKYTQIKSKPTQLLKFIEFVLIDLRRSLFLLTPGELRQLANSLAYGNKGDWPWKQVNIGKELTRLSRRGLITIEQKGPAIKIKITHQGKSLLQLIKVKEIKIEKQRTWDKKWRVVAFDVPEKENLSRNSFRAAIKRLGFIQVQKSLWVNPYPCTEAVRFLADAHRVSDYVSLFEGSYIGKDGILRKHFNI